MQWPRANNHHFGLSMHGFYAPSPLQARMEEEANAQRAADLAQRMSGLQAAVQVSVSPQLTA